MKSRAQLQEQKRGKIRLYSYRWHTFSIFNRHHIKRIKKHKTFANDNTTDMEDHSQFHISCHNTHANTNTTLASHHTSQTQCTHDMKSTHDTKCQEQSTTLLCSPGERECVRESEREDMKDWQTSILVRCRMMRAA